MRKNAIWWYNTDHSLITWISSVGIYSSTNFCPCSLWNKQVLPTFRSPLIIIFTGNKKKVIINWSTDIQNIKSKILSVTSMNIRNHFITVWWSAHVGPNLWGILITHNVCMRSRYAHCRHGLHGSWTTHPMAHT